MLIKNTIFYLFSIYPFTILVGNLAINLVIFLISILYLCVILKKEDKFILNDKLFLLLIFFFFSLLLNLFFSNNVNLSYPRVIKFIFVIFFVLSFRFIICNFKKSQIKKIYFLWSALFSVVLIDLLIEYFTGKNILGLISAMPGQRLASFTGGYTVGSSESVIGYFFYGFILVFLTIFQNLIKNQSINIFVAYSLIAVSFLIGERANFIRVFLIVNIYIFLIYEINYRTKILYFLILLISIVGFVNFNPKYKIRYYNQIKNIIINDGTLSQKSTTQYGAHYNVAKEIFKNNLLFGVGIKNFRVESASKRYDNLDHPKNHLRISTHPHQIHYEFLSETGLVGYLSFLIFICVSLFLSIKKYLNEKNIFQLSGILFVLSYILPILPTGSFLSTFNSSIFWINYSIMMSYVYIRR